jgi:serine/threonine protein kinase
MEPPVVSSSLLTRGARLGRYELIDHLATGGMAELFLARTVGEGGFEKIVVLKRILPQLAQNADFVSMFLDEARLAALLHHPNIAQVFDIGQVAGSFFFVMEHVHGRDLRDVVKAARPAGGVPLQHALAIVAAAAAGLHYAHEKTGPDGRALHLVHRDVSPANLIVTFDGGVKLVDFGVAKARSRHVETRGGTLKGKIAYMSPEQCRGEPVDRRSDVFALGIVLYELTTGVRLFRGDNEFALLQQIATEDVPPASLRRPDYPTALEAIVMRALARDRNHRYATAEDLQVDLEEFAVEHKLKASAIQLRRWMRGLFPNAVPPPVSTSDVTRRPTAVLLPDEPQLKVTAPLLTPAPAPRHAEGTPVREARPGVTAPLGGRPARATGSNPARGSLTGPNPVRGSATGSNPARDLPLRAPPDPAKPLTKEDAVAKMPSWLAAELFPTPTGEMPVVPVAAPSPAVTAEPAVARPTESPPLARPTPESPPLARPTPESRPLAVRPTPESRPLVPHRAPTSASKREESRKLMRKLVAVAGVLALGTAALVVVVVTRESGTAAPVAAPVSSTPPAPPAPIAPPTPPPPPPGHAAADGQAMLTAGVAPIASLLAASVVATPPSPVVVKRKKPGKKPAAKKGFWDPDSPFLPREKK